jgi:hypothetical protein
LDYYVIPETLAFTFPTSLKVRNGAEIDRFRVPDRATALGSVLNKDSLVAGIVIQAFQGGLDGEAGLLAE